MREKILISKNISIFLKGIFCLMVLLHHLVRTGNEGVDALLDLLGPLAVGGFYFLSGYGIATSYRAKGNKYIKKLVFKRIPIMYLILVVTNLIYLGVYCLTGNAPLSFCEALSSVFYISFATGFVQLYSWIYFIPNLIIFYVVFAVIILIVEKIKKNSWKAQYATIVFVFVEMIVILLLGIINKQLPDLRAYFCFPLGLICGAYCKNVYTFAKKNRPFLILLFSFLMWILATFLNVKEMREYIMPLLFCLFVVSIIAGVDIGGKMVTLWFGKISLYIYIFHGAFFKIFKHFTEFDSWNLFLLVLLCSVAISLLVFYVLQEMKNCLLRKRRKKLKTFN